jgi:hypothetical protein
MTKYFIRAIGGKITIVEGKNSSPQALGESYASLEEAQAAKQDLIRKGGISVGIRQNGEPQRKRGRPSLKVS